MRPATALLILTGMLWHLPVFAENPTEFPQARVDAIDASQWPHLRVLATVLDAAGRPVQPKALKKLAVVDPKKPSAPPLVVYRQGKPDEAHKDAKLQTRDKAGVPLAAMFVVAGYQQEALRLGSLGQRLKEALAAGWKQLGKGDRVNAIWYGDRLYRMHALPGHLSALDDVEIRQKACQDALNQARSGLALETGQPEDKDHPPPPPGTWLCGLQEDVKTVGGLLKSATFKGYFPRLFALGPPFYEVSRYCAPPPEDLEVFGPFTAANAASRKNAREMAADKGEPAEFVTSAFDEALTTLLLDAKPPLAGQQLGEEQVIVLVSDGRDGYFRELELCEAHPPKKCLGLEDKEKLKKCIAEFLDQRVAAAQVEFRQRAVHWLGLLRAAGIRVFAVGLGAIGRDFELDRLRLLAERSGGTWRLAADEDAIGPAVLTTMAELSGQLVLDFEQNMEDGAERPQQVQVALDVELDPALARVKVQAPTAEDSENTELHPKCRSLPRVAPVPPLPTWQERAQTFVRQRLVALQEFLGYRTYVVLGWVLVGLASVMLTALVLLGVLTLVKKLRKKG